MKFEEFRPVPHGPCTRIRDAWVELYDNTAPDRDRSIIIDFVDRALETYTNYNNIDDFEDRPSHALWCIPEGATHRLWENRTHVVEIVSISSGRVRSEEIGNLNDVGFGDDTSCSEWLGGPFADAGNDVIVECASPSVTPAQLDGTGSAVIEGGPAMFLWEAAGVTFDDPTSPTPTGQFPKGVTTVTLTVSDGMVAVTDTVDVRVVDTAPPGGPCDLPLNIDRARVRRSTSPRGSIIAHGDVPLGRTLTFQPANGLVIRVLDGLTLDESFLFAAADCRLRAGGQVLCQPGPRLEDQIHAASRRANGLRSPIRQARHHGTVRAAVDHRLDDRPAGPRRRRRSRRHDRDLPRDLQRHEVSLDLSRSLERCRPVADLTEVADRAEARVAELGKF